MSKAASEVSASEGAGRWIRDVHYLQVPDQLSETGFDAPSWQIPSFEDPPRCGHSLINNELHRALC
jgi:hypothetical protein